MNLPDSKNAPAGEAVKERRDYTKGGIWAAVVSLSLPMAFDQVITSTTRLIEVYYLGRLGPEVLAASSLGAMVSFVLISAAMGIGIAGLALVARRVGEGDGEAAATALAQVLVLAGAVGVLVGGFGVALSRPLLTLLGATGGVLHHGTDYLRVSFTLLPLLILSLSTNRVLRGAGEARTALWTMAVGSGVTALLTALLVTGPGPAPALGIVGAALAVGVGQGVSWTIAMVALASGRLRLRLRLRHARPQPEIMIKLVRIGLPVTGQLLLRSTSRLLLAPLITAFGPAALAAYGIMVRLMMFPLSIGFGLGNAAGTLVGQNLGAGQSKRAATSAWAVAALNVGVMALFVAGFVTWARPLVGALVEAEPEVVDQGVTVLRIMAPAYLFSALGVVMGRSLDGAGDTLPAMWVNLLTLWCVQLPAAWLLATSTALDANGIWIGIGVANALNALILAGWFARGGWTSKVV